jgi:hypothetical protein
MSPNWNIACQLNLHHACPGTAEVPDEMTKGLSSKTVPCECRCHARVGDRELIAA